MTKLVAFYLPQFHPIPENDQWWGKGFTEWTNVTRAVPLFAGHYQPRLPADLGFYDLRVRESRRDQIQLARRYGIGAFCYYYYWFSGKRLLHAPLDDMLRDPGSDMPFCLCWANENWTRRWDGAEHEVLVAQRYLPDDDLRFIEGVIPFFRDQRYLRVDGKPLLLVYRLPQLPDPRRSIGAWREQCRAAGIGEIHVAAVFSHGNQRYEEFGADSGVEFPPHTLTFENLAPQILFDQPFQGAVLDYGAMAAEFLQRRYAGRSVFRTVIPGWDNTPRAGARGVIVLDSTPENYEYWLAQTIRQTGRDHPDHERLVFINAWNEWAEGCHLEPDRRHGHAYLESTLRALSGQSGVSGFAGAPAAAAPRIARNLRADLGLVLRYHAHAFHVRTRGRLGEWVRRHPRLLRVVRWLRGGVRSKLSKI